MNSLQAFWQAVLQRFVVVTIALSTTATWSRADTVFWTGTAGVWSDSGNWAPHSPTTSDTVVITNGGSVTLDVSPTVVSVTLGLLADCGSGTLMMNGQTLRYSGQFQVNPCGQLIFNSGGQLVGVGAASLAGSLNWAGGILPFGGTITLATNCTLSITSGADHDMPGVVLTNYGTVAWSEGRIRGGGSPGTVIHNYGLWDCQGDSAFNTDFGMEGLSFKNFGTFRKSAGTNSTIFSPSAAAATLDNLGQIEVQTGAIVLNGGGRFLGGSVGGNGLLLLASGGFNINGTITTTNVQLTGGGLVGVNVLQGALSWAGGNWNSASTVTLNTNGELDIASGNDHDLAFCTFTNLGTVKWLDGRLRGGGTPGTVIYNIGTWEVQCDRALNSDYVQEGVQFHNLGTFRKLGTSGASTFSPSGSAASLDNDGLVDIESGSMVLNGGGEFRGGSVTGSGTLLLNGGSFWLDGTITTTNVQFTAGFFSGDNTIVGGLTWAGGSWNGASSVTVANNSELDIVSGNDHDLPGCTLINQGTVEWLGGRIRGGGAPGTVIYNLGLWEARCDQVLNSDFQQYGLVFNNSGTFRKLGTSGSTVFSPVGSAAYFNNSGAVDIQTGSVVLNGGGLLSSGIVTGSGVLYLSGGAFTINSPIATTSNLQFIGGSLVGNNTLLGGFTWVSGSWSGANSITVTTNSYLDITSGADHDLYSCLFTNYGLVRWLGGRVRGGGNPGTFLYNYSVWDSQGDLVINSDGQQQGFTFYNLGTFRKSSGANSTVFSPNSSPAMLNNQGKVDIQTGSVVLNGGGRLVGGTLMGGGPLYLAAGDFNINGMVLTTNAQLVGGALTGTNVLRGGMTWVNGNWNGAHRIALPAGSELIIVSGADHDLASCEFTNLGTVEWIAGRIRGGGTPGTVIHNLGLWEVQCDQSINSDYGQSGVVFNNTGTLRKFGTIGITLFAPNNSSAMLNQSGIINIETGSLMLNGGGSFSGGSVTGGGMVYLNAGGFNLSGGSTTPNVQLTGGGLVRDNLLRGGFTWVNGNLNSANSVTVAGQCELDITSNFDHDLAYCTFTNLGTVKWLGGRLRGGGTPGTVIYNVGSWEAQCDQVITSEYGQYGVAFNNLGTFRKSGTTGMTVFSPVNSRCGFNNLSGGVELDSGTLSLPGDFSLAGGSLTIGIGGRSAGQFGSLAVGGRATLDGHLGVTATEGFGYVVNDQFQVVACANPLLTGPFGSVSLPAGLTVGYTPSAVILLATNNVVQLRSPLASGGQFQFSLLTVFGQSYTVQQCTNLAPGNWSFYTNFVGDGSLIQIETPAVSIPQRYFRVVGP